MKHFDFVALFRIAFLTVGISILSGCATTGGDGADEPSEQSGPPPSSGPVGPQGMGAYWRPF